MQKINRRIQLNFLQTNFGFENEKHYFDITTSGEVFADKYKDLKDKKCFFIGEDKGNDYCYDRIENWPL